MSGTATPMPCKAIGADEPLQWLVPPEVAQQAVEWWMLLQTADMNQALQQEWQSWRVANPLHEQAWQRISSVNQRLAGLVPPQQTGIARAVLSAQNSSRPQRRRVVQALAVLMFTGSVAWQAEQQIPWRHWVADVRTARGERRRMVLEDGTQLVLNSDSALNIQYNALERRLRLLAGEVLITTARDAHQPARDFLVETAEGQAQALGTRYLVRAGNDASTQVSVFDGAVKVRPRLAPEQAMVLHAGQQAVLRAQSISSLTQAYEESTAWTEGMLVAKGMPLAEMLRILQPYSACTLGCEPAVAAMRISGTYPLDDVPQVLNVLGALPQLQVRRLTRWWGRQEVLLSLASSA